MTGLVKRNLWLYFEDRSGVFFSLLGALIAFVLYIIFLKHNMATSWDNVPYKNELLDKWLIGGTLATTAITTTGNAVSTAVTDRENGRLTDLMMTDVHSETIQAAYAVNGIIVGTIMQIVMLISLSVYFWVTDGIHFDWTLIQQLLAIAVLNATIWTMFNVLIQTFIHKMSTLGTVQSLIGTAAGFFVGVYLPIGMLPHSASHLIKWTPAPYSASLYRRVLMAKSLKIAFKSRTDRIEFERIMGINISIHGMNAYLTDTIILSACALTFAIFVGLLARRSQMSAVQVH